jgi:hypothetical protein
MPVRLPQLDRLTEIQQGILDKHAMMQLEGSFACQGETSEQLHVQGTAWTVLGTAWFGHAMTGFVLRQLVGACRAGSVFYTNSITVTGLPNAALINCSFVGGTASSLAVPHRGEGSARTFPLSVPVSVGPPQDVPKAIRADEGPALTVAEMARALDRVSRIVDQESIPLPFNPDDFPLF